MYFGVSSFVRPFHLCALAAALAVCGAAAAHAQSQNDIMLPPVQAPAVDPQALSLARALVAKTEPDGITGMPWTGMPMGMFMQQWHITPREHAQVIFHEALIPVLQKHAAEFREIEAKTYATDLGLNDLKAINAFYDSPAGLATLRMHEKQMKLNMAGLQQLLQTLKPEMQTKVDDALKTHGWTKG